MSTQSTALYREDARVNVVAGAPWSDPFANADAVPSDVPNAPTAYAGPTNFTWLIRGRLGGMPRPGLHRDLAADLSAVTRIGVDTVVSLTEEWQPPVATFAEHNLKSVYVPIPDMQPPTMDQAVDTCSMLADMLQDGASIAFHCHAGRGRTGTLLAAMLIWYLPDFDAAITRIKRTNRYWIESSSQMNFLQKLEMQRRVMLGRAAKAIHRTRTEPDAASQGDETRSETVPDPPMPGKQNEVNQLNSEKGTNMSLDKALQTAMTKVPECLASGYTDMESGMLIGIQTLDSHPQEVLDLLAAATADLFQGSSVVQIENIFKGARGSKDENHYFNEILVFSENLIHMFMRTKSYPNHVVCFVCRKSANPGMVMTKARMSLEEVTNAV
ncbi:tyrosine-protein phosphatase [Cognatiyoonia sp. IB215182]|uniref:protein-tyrosine phosphatase family protein n=1 Tax=Cognatiyoonia sp. IB215182 TaxID=3097353 RepID=UPI002A172F5E|nr:tyrosine-protein phosphatase [Cognatiyoonia sp. IB215182]MDX8354920.1 tyrosine-protein phosphatase [Cognatiyoonia sp. IB215182]